MACCLPQITAGSGGCEALGKISSPPPREWRCATQLYSSEQIQCVARPTHTKRSENLKYKLDHGRLQQVDHSLFMNKYTFRTTSSTIIFAQLALETLVVSHGDIISTKHIKWFIKVLKTPTHHQLSSKDMSVVCLCFSAMVWVSNVCNETSQVTYFLNF